MTQLPKDQRLDDDDRLGLPYHVQRDSAVASPPKTAHEEEELFLRADDSELGRPSQYSDHTQPLSDAERQALAKFEEEEALRELQEAEELLETDPIFGWFGWLAHPLAAAILLGSIGLLGLFLYSQVLTVLNDLAQQPELMRYSGYFLLSLLSAVVVWAMLRLAWVYFRLRRNKQLNLAGLRELNQRTRLRWLAQEKNVEARYSLEQYLREFPLDSAAKRQWKKLGVAETLLQQLRKNRDRLLDTDQFVTSEDWFARFKSDFQDHLDAEASKRIKYWAKRTGFITAVSPNGFVDTSATLYFSFAMILDLCRLYHLRVGSMGTAVLLSRVFFQSYLSGQLNDWEKLTEDQLNHLFSPHGPVYEMTAARVISKVGSKAASGALNYFLLSRLGKHAQRMLRPIA